MQILELWQFPIKGFGGSQVDTAKLTSDGYFPHDRYFAVSNGGQKIATARSGTWFPKAHFLQLNVLFCKACSRFFDHPKCEPVGQTSKFWLPVHLRSLIKIHLRSMENPQITKLRHDGPPTHVMFGHCF